MPAGLPPSSCLVCSHQAFLALTHQPPPTYSPYNSRYYTSRQMFGGVQAGGSKEQVDHDQRLCYLIGPLACDFFPASTLSMTGAYFQLFPSSPPQNDCSRPGIHAPSEPSTQPKHNFSSPNHPRSSVTSPLNSFTSANTISSDRDLLTLLHLSTFDIRQAQHALKIFQTCGAPQIHCAIQGRSETRSSRRIVQAEFEFGYGYVGQGRR